MWKNRKLAIIPSVGMLILLACSISGIGCCRDRTPAAHVWIELELQPDLREYRDLNAEIRIDGKLVGTVENGQSQNFRLTPGEHEIELSLDGFVTKVERINALNRNSHEFKFVLTKR